MKLPAATVATLKPWFPSLDFDSVSIVTGGPVCWFIGTVLRKRAMVFSPFIFFEHSSYRSSTPAQIALLAHELKHIEQYRRYGHVSFLVRYLWHLTRAGFHYSRDLPLEAEAYALQAEVQASLEKNSPKYSI